MGSGKRKNHSRPFLYTIGRWAGAFFQKSENHRLFRSSTPLFGVGDKENARKFSFFCSGQQNHEKKTNFSLLASKSEAARTLSDASDDD